MQRGESVRTIIIALAANLVIAVAKLVAGLLSRSTAMLAEAAHSFADSMNEVLLGFSLHRARRPPDASHPLGHGRERFLWAFMAAIASFLIGGCISGALAVHSLLNTGETTNTLVSWIVLAVSFAADGTSWLQGMRQARHEASARGRSVWMYLLHSSDPIARAIVVEDSAALVGLVFAAAGLLLSHLMHSDVPDSIASLLIGILLAITAFELARPLAEFLIGRSLPPEQLQKLHTILEASPAVEQVVSLQAVYIGPEEVIVAAKIHPSSQLKTEELTRAMDDLDHELRAQSPFVADVYLDLTTTYRQPTVTSST